uniref:Uncharacterized protein n=1 Tax=Pseudomonas phage HRDY3 TaxID=3236930 RepID=A0AB39CDJ2_9VIRU
MLAQTTERGFPRLDFVDRYGHMCSLQESSLATEAAIWFGPNEAEPEHMVHGKGWVPYVYPEGIEVLHHTRAHITQRQMKEILPILEHFTKFGEMPEIEQGMFLTQRNRWRLAAYEMRGWRYVGWAALGFLMGIAHSGLQSIGAI